MKLSEYEIVVKSICNGQRRVITAFGVPKICSELKNQSDRIAVEKYSFLQNLQLANQAHLDNTNIEPIHIGNLLPAKHSEIKVAH